MSKPAHLGELALGARRSSETLVEWLHRELKAAILTGRCRPGHRLPSSRTLARQQRVARGTVLAAFEQLTAEGYLHSQVGDGTRVAPRLPQVASAPSALWPHRPPAAIRIGRRGASLVAPFPAAARAGARAFTANVPSVTEFPVATWARLIGRRMRLASPRALIGGDVFGLAPLRAAIARHLGETRGVIASPDQVIVLNGTQQALDLVARVVLDPGDAAWVEDPGYPGASEVLRAAGANVVPIPVDDRGLDVAAGVKHARRARLVYSTPAHQFPLGMPLALERRLALLAWARKGGAVIFEDDYDSEFRFDGRPLAALQGLDPTGAVILAGSFSKLLFPALRLAYAVVPPALVEPLSKARSLFDRYPRFLEQVALADFIEEGRFAAHLRRMRGIYAERWQALVAAADAHWGEALTLAATDTGLQTVGFLRKRRPGSDLQLARRAAAAGVEVVALSRWDRARRWGPCLQLGFAAATPKEIDRAARVLGRLLRERD